MIKKICKNINTLKKPSTDLKPNELVVVANLVDTLTYNLDKCVGMAANMIGVNKNVIAVVLENKEILVMINPTLIMKKGSYEAEEGCLSLDGVRKTTRYKKIEVKYFDVEFKEHVQTFENFEAQIVQHELDHLFGRII